MKKTYNDNTVRVKRTIALLLKVAVYSQKASVKLKRSNCQKICI